MLPDAKSKIENGEFEYPDKSTISDEGIHIDMKMN